MTLLLHVSMLLEASYLFFKNCIRGLKAAQSLQSKQVKAECAAILEGLKASGYGDGGGAGCVFEWAGMVEEGLGVVIGGKIWWRSGWELLTVLSVLTFCFVHARFFTQMTPLAFPSVVSRGWSAV